MLKNTNSDNIAHISAESLKDEIENSTDLTLVNVLSKETFDDCHIIGSINAPLENLKTIAKQWNKKIKIVVYCASSFCSASKEAYKILHEMGFEHLLAYEGGIKEWKQKGFPCFGECKMDYLK